MKTYKKISFWENRRRIQKLENFRNNIITYFDNIHRSNVLARTIENEHALDARIKINTDLFLINSFIISANVNPIMFAAAPIVTGGRRENLNVITNIFNAYRFGFERGDILDIVERTMGVYKSDRFNSFARTFNPFFWIGLILDWLVSLPFKLIGKIGFNEEKIESSRIGKIIKGILYSIIVFAAFLTILEKMGWLNNFKIFVQNIFVQK